MLAACLVLASCLSARAEGFSVSTNILGYAWLGTMNAEASYAFARRWTVTGYVAFNPWTFNASDADRQFQSRQQTYAAGARFWPWHVYSGWWISGKAIYQEYNMGGIISRRTEEGDSAGAGFSASYCLVGPAIKKRNSRSSISLLPCIILKHNKNANILLWRSNRDLQILL